VTFAQLQSFATVARLGSVQAAARELGVSEPSVSGAIAALRRDLGDELYVRAGGGIRLTPGGRRLAAAADEILGLIDQAREGVRGARGEATGLRIAATADVAELGATSLLDTFTRRNAGLDVRLRIAPAAGLAGLLGSRVVEATLGPRPRLDAVSGLEAVPFLRYGLVVLAAPDHRFAGSPEIPAAALAGERWLAGPAGADPVTATGAFLAHPGLAPHSVRSLPSHAEARAAAAAGEGIMLAVAHAAPAGVREELVTLAVRGMPLPRLWYASFLGPDRRTPAAWALRRFVTTPEATQAMLARAAERFRPAVHVGLWS
jgi:DNA-binding transcriptional LysR family regulator